MLRPSDKRGRPGLRGELAGHPPLPGSRGAVRYLVLVGGYHLLVFLERLRGFVAHCAGAFFLGRYGLSLGRPLGNPPR